MKRPGACHSERRIGRSVTFRLTVLEILPGLLRSCRIRRRSRIERASHATTGMAHSPRAAPDEPTDDSRSSGGPRTEERRGGGGPPTQARPAPRSPHESSAGRQPPATTTDTQEGPASSSPAPFAATCPDISCRDLWRHGIPGRSRKRAVNTGRGQPRHRAGGEDSPGGLSRRSRPVGAGVGRCHVGNT